MITESLSVKEVESQQSEKQPLVSVRVSTYKSSATVVETLESIKAQTYQNIELIISDDCSPDDTVEVCRSWLEQNKSRFANAELITTPVNTGVSGNINRGTTHCHGEWLKGIAGDDLLIPTAIEDYMRFITENDEKVCICVSDVDLFSDEGEVPQRFKESYATYFQKEQEPYLKQWHRVCYQNIFVGPGYFYSRELFDSVGGYSSEYGNSEEWPFVYKVLKAGNRIFAVNRKLVRYRVSSSSLSHKRDDKGLISENLFRPLYRFFFEHPYKDMMREHRYLAAWHYAVHFKTWNYCYKTNNSWLAKNLHKYFIYFSPYVYLRKMGIVD